MLLAGALMILAAASPGAAEGQAVFQRCYACHSVDPTEKNLPGPNLAGVVGRRAGAEAGFDYSPAMRKAAAAGLVWTEANLDRYLADPDALAPGGEMTMTLKSAKDRQAVIAYLKGRR